MTNSLEVDAKALLTNIIIESNNLTDEEIKIKVNEFMNLLSDMIREEIRIREDFLGQLRSDYDY